MQELYEIKTFQDLIRLLKERPDYLEELRRLILTEELINLPKRFEEFLKNDFEPLKRDVEVLKQDVAILKQDVAILKQEVAILKQEVAKLKNDVNSLKGSDFERRVRERAPAYFGKLIRKCKLISFEELAFLLEDKVDEGIITEEEKDEVLLVDVVVSGYLKDNREKKVMIAGEVSLSLDENDIERAKKRAEIISRAYGISCIAVVIGEASEIVKKRAEELDVILV